MTEKTTREQLEALRLKFAGPDHKIYKSGSLTLFVNRSGNTTSPPPEDMDSNPRTPADQSLEEQVRTIPALDNEEPLDLQNLPFDIAEEALKTIAKTESRLAKKSSRRRQMAKVTFRYADSPDDPIYNGGFVISSGTSNRESQQPKKSSPTIADGQETTDLDSEELPPDITLSLNRE